MARVFYIHWNQEEAAKTAEALVDAGHDVRFHWSSENHAQIRDFEPDIVAISIDRLPSHGRAIAEWFWEAKKRRSIPILFVGGTPDKVEATLARFPGARHCASDSLADSISSLAREAVSAASA